MVLPKLRGLRCQDSMWFGIQPLHTYEPVSVSALFTLVLELANRHDTILPRHSFVAGAQLNHGLREKAMRGCSGDCRSFWSSDSASAAS